MNFELCCLARILGRSWRKGTASRQASKASRLWIMSQDEARLEAGKFTEKVPDPDSPQHI